MTGPDDVGLSPLGESGFAVDHGLVGTTPDVAVVGAAVRRAREAAQLTVADIGRQMTRRGFPTDEAAVASIEGAAVHRMGPRAARLLAAILDNPLSAIEAVATPWPPGQAELDVLRAAGADPVVLGQDVVVRTAAGSYLGLLRCRGDASVLDSRTYRLTAATLLNGGWSHLAGALLVSEMPPQAALAVDALDCVSRSHAPSGLWGFSRLAEPEPIAAALASYDRAYAVTWSDPKPLVGLLTRDEDASGVAGRPGQLGELAERLSDEGRRARQPGKRPGYESAADWFRSVSPETVAGLVDELASLSPAAAHGRLGEVLSP